MSEIKGGGQLKQLSGILYSPLLLLSLYAWPKFNMEVQPIPEGGKDLHRGGGAKAPLKETLVCVHTAHACVGH